ncbi:MAG: trypsin-like serine peptidase [Hyphomicrobiaceae bacterium]
MRRHHLYLIAAAFIAQAPSADALPRAGDLQALGGHSAIQEIAVIGKDTRRRVPKRLRKATRGIGIITDTVKRTKCTAFCVADDAIVTNNHCLAWGFKKKFLRTRNLRRFRFRLGKRKTRLRWHNIRPTGNPYLSTLSSWPRKNRANAAVDDWTAARLAKPICKGKNLKLASEGLIRAIAQPGGLKVAMIGFHGDRSRRRLTYSECYIAGLYRALGNGYSVHSCDSKPMSSGSPIIYISRFGLDVIAINKGWIPFKKRHTFQFGRQRNKRLKRVNVATLPLELNWKLPAFLAMKFIDAPTTTRELQRLLKAGDFFRGKIDGKVSVELTWAIGQYQHSRNAVRLGIPTRKMLLDLKAQ